MKLQLLSRISETFLSHTAMKPSVEQHRDLYTHDYTDTTEKLKAGVTCPGMKRKTQQQTSSNITDMLNKNNLLHSSGATDTGKPLSSHQPS